LTSKTAENLWEIFETIIPPILLCNSNSKQICVSSRLNQFIWAVCYKASALLWGLLDTTNQGQLKTRSPLQCLILPDLPSLGSVSTIVAGTHKFSRSTLRCHKWRQLVTHLELKAKHSWLYCCKAHTARVERAQTTTVRLPAHVCHAPRPWSRGIPPGSFNAAHIPALRKHAWPCRQSIWAKVKKHLTQA